MKKKSPKIVVFDIETMPDFNEVMKVWTRVGDFPGRTIKGSIQTVICFGYKIVGHKKAHCISSWDFPKQWKKNINDDENVVRAAYEILKDADAISGHYSKKFDIKVLNTKFAKYRLSPLANIPHIDTCALAKTHFSLFSNSLDNVANLFGCETKMENGGWDLWVRVLNKEKKACKIMAKYCVQDVEVSSQVLEELRPYAKNYPNYNHFNPSKDMQCRDCGSTNLHKHGFRRTRVRQVQRYQCQDCGKVNE